MLPSSMPTPLYDPHHACAAYHLRYSWSGWPSGGAFSSTPSELLPSIAPSWEADGMRLLEFRWTGQIIQLLFSATPLVSPDHIAHRAKGRLSHALRSAGMNIPFSRKLAIRSIGDNTRKEVEQYIERQVGKESFVDASFARQMRQLTVVRHDSELSRASDSARGRYWYNLHVVLVAAERFRITDLHTLTTVRDAALRVAAKKEHWISRLSVMNDHLHMALRGRAHESPADIVFAYQNNLAYALGRKRLWQDSYYVGTFGEYNMDAVRRRRDEI
jgi:REP element-mobilizing transposase RayT